MYIKNNLSISADMKMSEIILSNHYILMMLEHFGIEQVVKEKTVREICHENKIGLEIFLSFIHLFNGEKYQISKEYTFEDFQIIINFLNNGHKYYLKEKFPKIERYIEKMSELNTQSEILMVKKFFKEYVKEVTHHLNYETQIVFPYMTSLFMEIKGTRRVKSRESSQDNYSVKEYREHHNDIEEKLTDLKNLLIKYLPQKNDQEIRRKLLFSLFELEFDLNIHTQIEDRILIPMVEKLEQKARK